MYADNPVALALREVRAAAMIRHEKARRVAKRQGRHDFPLLPYECSLAFEVEFSQRVSELFRRR